MRGVSLGSSSERNVEGEEEETWEEVRKGIEESDMVLVRGVWRLRIYELLQGTMRDGLVGLILFDARNEAPGWARRPPSGGIFTYEA